MLDDMRLLLSVAELTLVPLLLRKANTTCDGEKESDGEDVEVDTGGNSSEDLRKVALEVIHFCVFKLIKMQ